MKTKLNYLIIVLPLIMLSFYSTVFSKKNGAPASHTGAPGENSCGSGTTNCHFQTTMCATLIGELLALNTDVELSANGNVIDNTFEYTPGTTYNMAFTILNPTANGGFSLTSLNAVNDFVGTLTTTDPNVSVISNDSNTIDYVGHTVSLAMQSWTFEWEAPAVGTGAVTFYASANKANGAVGGAPINSCGDKIVPYKMEISEFVEPEDTTTAIQTVAFQKTISISANPIVNNSIVIETFVKTPKRFTVNVFDLSGKKVEVKEQFFHVGYKTIEIPMSQKGIFIVNITTDQNEYANFKLINN